MEFRDDYFLCIGRFCVGRFYQGSAVARSRASIAGSLEAAAKLEDETYTQLTTIVIMTILICTRSDNLNLYDIITSRPGIYHCQVKLYKTVK